MTARTVRNLIDGVDISLTIEKVPRIADSCAGFLRDDIHGRHQRRQTSHRLLQRIVDAQRGVEDVPELRNTSIE